MHHLIGGQRPAGEILQSAYLCAFEQHFGVNAPRLGAGFTE